MLDDSLGDHNDLVIGLPFAEDDLGKALPERPMMVDRRKLE